MTTGAPKNHAELLALASSMRRRLSTLYALGQRNDPWMAGQNFRSEQAHWIADLFARLEIRERIHDRAVFYRLVSQHQPVIQVDGTPFVNTVECFSNLSQAIRDARYLGLIEPDAIIDRRNPEPVINLDDEGDVAAEVSLERGFIYRRPFGMDYSPPALVLPSATLTQRPMVGQRYHIEIWIEKSTANEVLLPLGLEYDINIASFVGEVSATACKALVDRAIESSRPVRILHVTDFDPAGRSMPVAAARKIDFFTMQSGVELDIKLESVALTHEQCVHYQLPRTPIKETETRAAGFEARFGDGATELDALEALHPGALRQILIEQIERYYDHDLDDAVDAAVSEFEDELTEAESAAWADHENELAEIEERRRSIDVRFAEVRDAAQANYDAVVEPARQAYEAVLAQAEANRQAALEELRPEIEQMEEQCVQEATSLLEAIANELSETAPDPDMYDWPEPAEGDEDDDALYDSTRDYVEQVDAFRAYQGKDAEVGLAADREFTKACACCGKPFTTPNPKRFFCSKTCATKDRRRRNQRNPQAGKHEDDTESG